MSMTDTENRPMAGPGGWLDLTGRTALVVGASRGLGREAALALARAGANLVLSARDSKKLEETAARVRASGAEALVVPTDASVEEQVADMVDRAASTFGRLDILVHAAGIMHAGPSLKLDLADWNRVLTTNLTGAFLCCREAANRMKENGGSIILFSSAFHDRVLPYTLAYGVSKAGIAQLVRNLGHEWARFGIRVNGLAPGYFETEMPAAVLGNPDAREALLKRIPVRRTGSPPEIGPLVVYLASDASGYMTGELVRIDGGQSNYTS